MLFDRPAQFMVLGALLAIGWLFGYASHPGPRKWKRKLANQAGSFTQYHDAAEERLRTANARIAALEGKTASLAARHAEALATIETLRATPSPEPAPATVPVAVEAPAVATTVDPVLSGAVVEHAEPTRAPHDKAADPAMPVKGWFGSSGQDDLTRLRGIDGPMNTRLFGLGVTRFEDIEKLTAEDEMALEQRLAVPVGYIGREQWRHQAALLRAGDLSNHAERFGGAAVTA